jgi:hypothetical protein
VRSDDIEKHDDYDHPEIIKLILHEIFLRATRIIVGLRLVLGFVLGLVL